MALTNGFNSLRKEKRDGDGPTEAWIHCGTIQYLDYIFVLQGWHIDLSFSVSFVAARSSQFGRAVPNLEPESTIQGHSNFVTHSDNGHWFWTQGTALFCSDLDRQMDGREQREIFSYTQIDMGYQIRGYVQKKIYCNLIQHNASLLSTTGCYPWLSLRDCECGPSSLSCYHVRLK